MDFHSLSRRELQALCKRNKIPANATNVAMADSLKSIEIVEGMEELLLQIRESETVESSTESGMRLESPLVPPTGGRSRRRRNAETHLVPQTNRRNTEDDLLTPASQRRSVKQVLGTRRSARLAAKSARLLKGAADGSADFSKNGLFTYDCHKELQVNFIESLDDLDDIPGVTDGERTNLDENYEKKDDEQVDSSKKLDLTGIDAIIVVENSEQKSPAEAVPYKREVVSTVEEVKLMPTVQDDTSASVEMGQVSFGSKIDVEFDDDQASEIDSAGKDNDGEVLHYDNDEDPYLEKIADVIKLNTGNHDDSSATGSKIDEFETESDSNETESSMSNYSLAGMASDNQMTDEEILLLDEELDASHGAVLEPHEIEKAADDLPSLMNIENIPTPIKTSANKASSTLMEITDGAAASDNKENSESKMRANIVVKEISEAAIKLDEMGQLSKKFEEVHVTQKIDKTEKGIEVSPRPALQLIPVNLQKD